MINNVGNQNFIISKRQTPAKAQSNVTFKGKFNAISFIENNPVLSLYVIDFLGMQAPRITIDTLRNRKELGHLNYSAGRETALREFSTAILMYLSPGVIALGLGRLVAKHMEKKRGIDTKEFIGSKFLKVAKNKLKQSRSNDFRKMRQNFVEKMINSRQPFGNHKVDKLSAEETKQIVNEILKVNKSDEEGIKKIAEKLKHGNESRFNIRYGRNGKITRSAKNFVLDIITFRDGFIDESLKQAEKFNPKELLKDVSELCKNTIKFNRTKAALGFTAALGLLIAFPKVNIWITKKISGDDSGKFPGLQGLDSKNSNEFDTLKYLQEVKNANKK